MKPSVGKWTSPEDQAKYVGAYKMALREIPPADAFQIDTSFGQVQSYCWRSKSSPPGNPIILLPGRSSGTPMWRANIPDLARERTVYSFDALGDAGLSEQTAPIKSTNHQATWINEALESLPHPKLHFVGHSFGGWLAANYASHHPNRVASLILIEPVFTFQMIRLAILIKSVPFNMRFLPKKWRMGLLKEISGSTTIDTRDPVALMIDRGADYYLSKLPPPKPITKTQLQAWTFPTYVSLAENSGVHDSRKAMEVAKKKVKSLTLRLWPNATHSLPMEFSSELNKDVLDFIDRIDGVIKSF